VEPSESLKRQIFPKADEWLNRVQQQLDGCEKSISAESFLELLIQMRAIILQDAVMLRAQHPDNIIFKNEIFGTAEFLDFERRLLAVVSTEHEPEDMLLRRALPSLSAQISNMNTKIDMNHVALQQHINSLLEERLPSLTHVNQNLTAIRQGFERIQQACSFVASGQSNHDYDSPVQHAHLVANDQPVYRLDRNISTVKDLAREWFDGLAPNLMSVVELDRKYGTSWRREAKGERKLYIIQRILLTKIFVFLLTNSERQFYSRRLRIIKEVRRIAADEGISFQDASGKLDDIRLREQWSLTKL
jgi:hypothetical protein